MSALSANFREICCGKIASNVLYRSNHPICDGRQVKDIILAVNRAKIKTVINLSDSLHSLKSKTMYCPWYKKMFETNNVALLNVNMNFDIMEDKFCKKIKKGLAFMLKHEPPYLIHCEAGIDRTGFFSIILEAFMEAAFSDIVKDYMLSFVGINEYSPTDYKTGETFTINLFSNLKGEPVKTNENIQALSEKYLLEKIKLNDRQLSTLKNKLMERCL